MENARIQAAADLSVDLLIVVSCFGLTLAYMQVRDIRFLGGIFMQVENWNNRRDHSDLTRFAFEVGFFPSSHNALRS